MTAYRLFPSTSGPSSGAGYSGPFIAGVTFHATTGGTWLDGYWWWCCATGQDTGTVKAGLWQVTSTSAGMFVAGGAATSGALTAGAWNWIPLAAPLPLSVGSPYVAAIGYAASQGFPETDNQFGSGQPFAAGIVNGPLTAFSDVGGSLPEPSSLPQGLFSTGGTDPTAVFPASNFESSNFWVDVQLDTAAPAGASYRLWPGQPDPNFWVLDTPTNNFTLGTEFTLAASCALDAVWFYSPSGASQLPTDCGIWNVSGQSLVAGTHNASPSWSGAAGSGWVSVAYSGVTLPAGDYKVTVYNGAGTPSAWNATTFPYWSGGGYGTGGIVSGPLSAPNDAAATSPGQGTYNLSGAFAYPGTFAGSGGPAYWVDVQVTPAAASFPSGLLMAGIV
jgi:hypothetical protein